MLCTTDAATDTLDHHQAMRATPAGTAASVPTFRPDAVVNLRRPGWRDNIDALSQASGIEMITSYAAFIRALEQRRAFFKQMGATATDHARGDAVHRRGWPTAEAEAIFERALRGPGDRRGRRGASPATC